MRTEIVQVGVDSVMYACPNRALDPSGVVVNQRWRYEGGRPGEWRVVSEPDANGDARMVSCETGRYEKIPVGHLLAYWTCMDVPG